MDEYIVIFEIPIYSMPKKEFNEKWIRRIQKEYSNGLLQFYENRPPMITIDGHVPFKYHNYRKTCWKYSQVIGYIVVCFNGNEICAEALGEFYANDKRKAFKYNRSSLPYIRVTHNTYTRFNISFDKKNMFFRTNDELIEKVKSCVMEEAARIKKPLFVDTEVFDRTIDYIDLFGLLKNLSAH